MDGSEDEQTKTTPSADPSVYIFSDVIKQAMEGFVVAHRDSMAAIAEKNSEALTSRVGHPSQELKFGNIKPTTPLKVVF